MCRKHWQIALRAVCPSIGLLNRGCQDLQSLAIRIAHPKPSCRLSTLSNAKPYCWAYHTCGLCHMLHGFQLLLPAEGIAGPLRLHHPHHVPAVYACIADSQGMGSSLACDIHPRHKCSSATSGFAVIGRDVLSQGSGRDSMWTMGRSVVALWMLPVELICTDTES